jgi:hypothetical protein
MRSTCTARSSLVGSFGVIKEKGIRVSKSSHASVSLHRRADTVRARSLRAKGSGVSAVRLAGLLVIGLLVTLIVPSLASAAVPAHPFKEVFGSLAQPAFGKPSGITVDRATGDVYVIDLEDQTLSRYEANGKPAPFSALSGGNVIDGASGEDKTPQGEILSTAGSTFEAEVAVAPPSAGETAGDIYVTDALNQVVDIFASSGKYLGQQSFGYPCGVAVDSAGTVFVGSEEGEEAVYKLKPTSPGHLSEVAQFPTTKGSCQVAAGFGPAAGSVFVAAEVGNLTKLDAETGALDYEVFSGKTFMLSTDPVTGHLYASVGTAGSEVKEFDVSGAAPVEISSTTLSQFVRGVGGNSATGGFYADRESSSKLEVFGPVPVLHTVTVTVNGGGEVSETAGSPVPASGAISGCEESTGNCSAEYFEGEEPVFEAVAGSGSEFVKWSVEHAASTTCTGTSTPCKIKVGPEDVSASADFALSGFPLTIEKEGAGTVTVASVQSGLGLKPITCGAHCSELFTASTDVELTVTPGTGSEFTGWSTTTGSPGTCTGTTSPCLVTMGGAVTLKAGSALESEALTINESGPGGVECEFAHSSTFGACTSPQPYGTDVKVKATPDLGAELSSLSGTGSASSCSPGGCEFTITQPSSVTVEFAAIAHPSTLTVFKGGNGKGTVISLAPRTGISCGPVCEEARAGFEEGQTVELEESPQSGSVFAGWIGCRHVTATMKCQVKLGSAEVEATAVFLIEGKEGLEGKEGAKGKDGSEGKDGKEGKEGTTGKEGPAGKEGSRGERGQIGFPGEQGEQGPAGPAGAQGTQGAQGAQGPAGTPGVAGPVGPQGKEGPAGPPAKVTCKITQAKNKKAKVTCTVTYATTQAKSSTVHTPLRWQLLRHGHVIAHGASEGAPQIHLGALHRGRYVLYLADSHNGTVIHVR